MDATGQANVDIGGLLPKTGPFGRLRVMLTLSGELRTLVSAAAWHWPGLRHFDRARFHGPVPPNLIELDCKNIQRDDEGLTIVCAGDRPDALLRFDADLLRLTAPGIYASVERAGQPASLAVPIHAGSNITLGGNLANTLRLTCDNPDAILTIGEHVEPHAFARSNVRRVGFALLMTALEACEGKVTIHYRGSWDAPHTVCKLTRAETPTRFEVIRRVDYTEVVLATGNPIGSVRLDCSELITGRRMEIDIPIDGESWRHIASSCGSSRATSAMACGSWSPIADWRTWPGHDHCGAPSASVATSRCASMQASSATASIRSSSRIRAMPTVGQPTSCRGRSWKRPG